MKEFRTRLKFAWRLLWADGFVASVFVRSTGTSHYWIKCSRYELQCAICCATDELNDALGCDSALDQAQALTNPTA